MRNVVGVLVAASLLVAALPRGEAQPVLGDPQQQMDPRSLDPRAGSDAAQTVPGPRIPITAPDATEVLTATQVAPTLAPPPISLEEPIDPDRYICGPGDVFELNFWGQQNFRLRLSADLEGRAFISKVGFVTVNGKTLSAVRKEVNRKVRGNYPGLNFELALISPRSFLVHVVDFVKQPGSYVAHPLERVSVVLARAGGATGSRRRIAIHHRTGSDETADLVRYELTGDTRYNPYLLDGDIIKIPFAQLTAVIAGAVRRPGTYELIATKDIAELIDLAGGTTSAVARSLPIRLVRRNEHQQQVAIDLPFEGMTTPNHELRDDDIVTVRSSDELERSVLLIGAFVGAETVDPATTSKRVPFVEGDTVLSMLERAGGIKSPGDLRRSYISRPHGKAVPELIPIDLDALLVKREFSADKAIAIGDTIVVPPMQYSVLVEGAVVRAGLYPFNPQLGIDEYIAHAGGRTRTAKDIEDVKLIDWNGATRPYVHGLRPGPGDAIVVPERNFTRAEVVQIVIAVAGLLVSGVAITLAATR